METKKDLYHKLYGMTTVMHEKWEPRAIVERPCVSEVYHPLLQPKGCSLLYGDKGMGVTGFALSLVLNNPKLRCAFLSAEMNCEIVLNRLLEMHLNNFPESKMKEVVNHFKNIKVKKYGPPTLAQIGLYQKQKWWLKMDVIILDRVDLWIEKEGENAIDQLCLIMSDAKANNQTLILTVRKPISSGMGSTKECLDNYFLFKKPLENLLDVSAKVYRPEYDGITEDENGASTAGKAQLIYEPPTKHPLMNPVFRFYKWTGYFEEME